MTVRVQRLGKLFDPADFELAAGCTEFAQSPQVLVMNDRIRIYFSSRRADGEKFISEVLWVDMDKTLSSVMAIADSPAIELGGLCAFDEHGIFPTTI